MLYTNREIALVLNASGLIELVPPETLRTVMDYYANDLRHYHDFDHITETLSWLNCVLEVTPEEDLAPYTAIELRLAALFHDIVYGSEGSPTNEKKSCEMFRQLMPDIPTEAADRVCELIMFTAKHGKLETADVPLAGQLMLDADIASLGQYHWEVFVSNNENIVEELKSVYTAEQIASGRKAFFSGMLAKKSIFLSQWFQERFESQARRNLRRASVELSGSIKEGKKRGHKK